MAVKLDGVLAYLQQRGDVGAFRSVGNAFGMFEGDDIEREHCGVRRCSHCDEVGGGDQSHVAGRCRGVSNMR